MNGDSLIGGRQSRTIEPQSEGNPTGDLSRQSATTIVGGGVLLLAIQNFHSEISAHSILSHDCRIRNFHELSSVGK